MRDHSGIKGVRRENKRRKGQHGPRTSGKSVFIIQEVLIKKGKESTQNG